MFVIGSSQETMQWQGPDSSCPTPAFPKGAQTSCNFRCMLILVKSAQKLLGSLMEIIFNMLNCVACNTIAVPLASELIFSKLDPKSGIRKAVFLYPVGVPESEKRVNSLRVSVVGQGTDTFAVHFCNSWVSERYPLSQYLNSQAEGTA